MPLGSSSAAPVMSPGPNLLSYRESIFFISTERDAKLERSDDYFPTLGGVLFA
jgi:hypothetical protein